VAESIILAISPDNHFLHAGRSSSLLKHLDLDAKPDLQYYDGVGNGYEVHVDSGTSGAPRLVPLGTVDSQVLLDRIDLVLAQLQNRLNADNVDDPSKAPRVPRPTGRLSDVLAELSKLIGTLKPRGDRTDHPSRSPFHNWIHRLGG